MKFEQASSTIEATLERFWPVGSVYLSVSSTNPAVAFGFGTWVAFGAGRCLVGVDAGDADFDAAEKTSGSKTVTLTEAQLPAHTHAVTDPGHTHVQGVNSTATGGLAGATPDTSTNTRVNSGYSTSSATTGVTVGSAGSGQAHPNVQPSIAVHIWKRTA
jgi:hypothetical protein